MAVIIDTKKIYDAFLQVGFEKDKASALVDAISGLEDGIATKSDIQLLRSEIEISEARVSTKMWVVGATIIGVLGTLNLLNFFVK